MNKNLRLFLIGYICISLLAPVGLQAATDASGLKCNDDGTNCKYTALEPIPGLQESGSASFADVLNSLFKVLFSISGLIAVGMLTVGGIQYMVSEVPGIKKEALEQARAAIYGILILAGSWLILHTINPNLLEFNLTFPQSSSSTNSTNPSPSSSSYSTYPASSDIGRKVAQDFNVVLRNTASMVAIFVTDRRSMKSADVISALHKFTDECKAGGIGEVGEHEDTLHQVVSYCKVK